MIDASKAARPLTEGNYYLMLMINIMQYYRKKINLTKIIHFLKCF